MDFKPDIMVDLEWMHKLSFRFDRFKVASATSHVYNCRCPVCGDSQKSNKLARFYFYNKKGQLNVFCHNCNYSHSFWTFMKDVCPNEFDEYKRDQMRSKLETFKSPSKALNIGLNKTTVGQNKPSQKASGKTLKGIRPITSLPFDHPAIAYLESRGFTYREMNRLLFANNFKKTAESISCEELSENFPKDQRIVIPFYDTEGNIEMIQGRALDNSSLRYISIKTDPAVDKIYGKYEVDRNETVYCVEGPFDSLFVDNCLATCDSNLTRADADVYIFDNQPRSKEIVKLMSDAIAQNKQIVIWPTSPNGKQDINDMIKLGVTREELMDVIRSRTFSGLKAKLEFGKWRKV